MLEKITRWIQIISLVLLGGFIFTTPVLFYYNYFVDKDIINTTCFTPGERCESRIVDIILSAKTSLKIQAYTFTNTKILEAIIAVKNRGIDVQVVLDEVNEQPRYNTLQTLLQNRVTVYIDFEPAIAHNKIIIVDNSSVVTGSFNFTTAAQSRNAENIVYIENDERTASRYVENFERRKNSSRKLN